MIKPTITLQIAYTKLLQQPDLSLGSLTHGNSGDAISTTRSIEAFTNSITNIPHINITMIIHSNFESPVAKAANNTTTPASK